MINGKASVQSVGKHVLIECYGKQSLLDAGSLKLLLSRAATAADATILSSHFHAFGEGMGFTGVLVLAESHITVHTWPENNYAAFDIFMCGDCQPQLAADIIVAADPHCISQIQTIERGGLLVASNEQPIKQTMEVI